jgi:membrane protein
MVPTSSMGATILRRVRDRLDRWQQSTVFSAFPVAVFKKFQEDRASRLAALIAYWGFFSLFPLLLAFVSILGFVLEDNPEFQKDVLDSTVSQIPVIGDQLGRDVTSLQGSGVALAIGIALAIWAGLGVTLAIENALDEVWAVPRMRRPDFFTSRLRGLAVLAVIGTANVVSTAVVTLSRNGTIQPPLAGILSFSGSVLVDFVVFLIAFRLMTAAQVSTRRVLPGVLLATLAWLGMQTLGGLYVEHVVARSSETYGVFVVVIGLLSWLWLAAQLVLVALEINVVLDQHLWPRSLFSRGLSAADEVALRRAAQAEQRDPRERIDVSFE